jgi:hypothetical protein
MFTTILIPIDTLIITARHIGTVVTGPTAVIIASITTIGRNFEAWPDCRAIARRLNAKWLGENRRLISKATP